MKSIFCSLFILATAMATTGCPLPTGPNDSLELDQGTVLNSADSCDSFVSSSALGQICKLLGCQPTSSCSIQAQELYAGSALKIPPNPSGADWNAWGGVGQALSNASICMLRDLSNGAKTTSANSQLFGLNFPINQTIGFTSFDPATKTFKGYQRVQVCVPVAGCFDAKIQGITAAVNEVDAGAEISKALNASGYPIVDTYGLVVTQEQSDEAFSASAPAITIASPYGDISVQPSMNYSSHLGTTLFQSGDASLDVGFPTDPVPLADLLGNVSGAIQESLGQLRVPDFGWVSQAGIGSRQAANPTGAIWSTSSGTPRPDLENMTQARTSDEAKPLADYSAQIAVAYKPPVPDFLLQYPLTVNPFDVFVTPKAEVAYSSQLEAEFTQGHYEQADVGLHSQGAVTLKSHVEALASFSLLAGIDLKVAVNLGFWSATLIDAHPRVSVPLSQNPGTNDLVLGQALSNSSPADDTQAGSVYHAPLTSIAVTPNSGAPDPTQFVNQCLASAPTPEPVPTPTSTPGNSDVFQNNLYYPCNICVGYPSFEYPNDSSQSTWTSKDGQAQLQTPSNQPDTSWTCDPDHVGCFDLCTYSPGSIYKIAFLGVAKTAMDMGVTSGAHPGLACNQPYRPAQ